MEFWFKWGQLQQNHRDREKEKIIPERNIRELFPRDGAMVVGTAKPDAATSVVAFLQRTCHMADRCLFENPSDHCTTF